MIYVIVGTHRSAEATGMVSIVLGLNKLYVTRPKVDIAVLRARLFFSTPAYPKEITLAMYQTVLSRRNVWPYATNIPARSWMPCPSY